MTRFRYSPLIPFLFLLFTGTVCSAMVVPYMGFFIVEQLGRDPWSISLYGGGVAILATLTNKYFSQRIDRGDNPFYFIGIAVAGYMVANIALSLYPTFWTVITFGVVGFGLSASAMSTMYSSGGGMAEQHNIERSQFNAYMRATTSTAWMVGPAISFLIADRFGGSVVFYVCAVVSVIWAALWRLAAPRKANILAPGKQPITGTGSAQPGLWLAATFVFCLSSAHSLTFSALPLFYVQEVGLPGYAPGTAFSMKTLVEVFAIFTTPFLIRKFGLRKSLFATTLLAFLTIQFIANVQTYPQMLAGAAMEGLYYGLYASLGISFVQSYAQDRPAHATALYWNTLIISGVLAGPAVGLIAQLHDFRTVILAASIIALVAAVMLILGARKAKSQ